ncbi:NUDIX domain-containing protein [Jonesiaceae bacterium BS-20]|uniref:NUDIX domain-containing protein n=1 Tax=Jonesiaceae bacterium BS-20 TaxID=3120821 RepID=A0AAU7DXX1_9MICO
MNTPDLTAPGSLSVRATDSNQFAKGQGDNARSSNERGEESLPNRPQARVIHVVAVLVQDHADKILLVRKKGTDTFIQPGGKPEPGEDTLTTAARELVEETGLVISTDRFEVIGEHIAAAANEPGFSIVAQCVRVRLVKGEETQSKAAAEIAEATWFTPTAAAAIKAAPLFQDIILPLAVAEGTSVRG